LRTLFIMSVSPEDLYATLHESGLPLRPPWAIAEWAFVRRCDGCLACVDVCSEGILRPGSDGHVEVDFRYGGCDFCGACAAACDRGALRRGQTGHDRAFRHQPVIDDTCLAMAGEPCRTCEAFCDNYAIRFNPDAQGRVVPQVLDELCNGCGACVGPCPVQSIRLLRPTLPAGR
jgi:ferredoxin-type protein NapF